ncbi:MAG: M48 family metalloprotease [Legionellaceae bacterium]|nr:M48 family metalloprotease [Legionellaceae bacterium]
MSRTLRILQRKTGLCLLMLAIFCQPFASNHAFNPYSNRELDELEKQFVELINQSSEVERHPLATEYINHIGHKITRNTPMKKPYFFIVKSPEINAFAGPGGYIGLNTQLILASESESELAGVMAHEIAHVRLHHLYRMLEHEKQMRIPKLASLLASAALGILNPALGSGAIMASLGGFAQDNINFIRSNEKEADRIGIQMLSQAGFDPRGMVAFFKKMQQSSRYYSANIPGILRTHPLDDDRIAEAEGRLGRFPAPEQSNPRNYYLFKELIRNAVAGNSKELLDFYRLQCQKSQPRYACEYGKSLAMLAINHFDEAYTALRKLSTSDPDNRFYQIALANSEMARQDHSAALKRLANLYHSFPENYASILSYGEGLSQAGEHEKASMIFLKGSRLFPRDLSLCLKLARTQAADGKKAYAYFTQAQCHMLQGKRKEAIYQLKQAKAYQKSDSYIQARIQARIDELKTLA